MRLPRSEAASGNPACGEQAPAFRPGKLACRMEYKGYTASVEFDQRDRIFVGRVLDVRDIISFHGASAEELRAAFHIAVDDYLADCSE